MIINVDHIFILSKFIINQKTKYKTLKLRTQYTYMNSYNPTVLKNNIQYLKMKNKKYIHISCNLYSIVLLILFDMIYK